MKSAKKKPARKAPSPNYIRRQIYTPRDEDAVIQAAYEHDRDQFYENHHIHLTWSRWVVLRLIGRAEIVREEAEDLQ